MVCPRCERLVGAGERKCPHCGAWMPTALGLSPDSMRWLRRLDMSTGLIGACVVLYVLSLLLDPMAIFRPRSLFDLLAPSSRALLQLGMTAGPLMTGGAWWTLCTAVFLHGSVLHILFNMVFLRQYLPTVVDLYGPVRAFVLFMVAGVVGFALSNIATGSPTIGASGALFGMFASLIVYGRRTGQHTLTQQLWGSAIMMFLMGLFFPNINLWAHAGGFAGGFVAAEAMGFAGRREHPGLLVLAGLFVLVTLAGFVLSFVQLGGLLR
jgi:rhomboid protease GluP